MIITININFVKFQTEQDPPHRRTPQLGPAPQKKRNVKISNEIKNKNHLERCGFEYGGIYAYKCTNEPHPKFEF